MKLEALTRSTKKSPSVDTRVTITSNTNFNWLAWSQSGYLNNLNAIINSSEKYFYGHFSFYKI